MTGAKPPKQRGNDISDDSLSASCHIYQRVALLGLGLIGSSIGHAIRRYGGASEIIGYARSAKTRNVAKKLGFVDEVYETARACISEADLVILCTPISAFGPLAREIAPFLSKGATLTDVGGVKQAVIDSVAPFISDQIDFIPAHPVAGTEESGPYSGFAELFTGRWCILTPLANARRQAVAKLSRFWRKLGARTEIMSAQRHDSILAMTSHLPHLIAYSIVGSADHLEQVTKGDVIKYSAGGFRDFTRIAASDAVMWRDIFLHNRDAVLAILDQFNADLANLQRAIRLRDGKFLEQWFHRTRAIRRAIVEARQDTAQTDFGRKPGHEPQK